ncbi:hypothetical protein A2Z22_01295 [Candidatus Woesebacteria bacterium RBG_16_34_12]|uniref:Pyrroloquinoline quinone-dependent pyranose dehydrogenase beta-propeller domain-containing protein n=1 Tax=Candidatus Woesebacteria bacterium RBG_16_34_12 TaxID=1802480 RepID=A0A1F7X8S9_9BACT|nr:MAG: hypothetical protein A2Z22_01295 [Candidatus Woesebacteria bacterium RBG_16_34_12]
MKNPHGLVFHNNQLFLAEEDKVVRYDYDSENYQLENEQILFGLPESGRHFTRTIKILGEKLYTSVGSSCDVCLEKDAKRAAILISNLDGSDLQIFTKGLRNTVFFTFDPSAGSGQVKMWGNDMGRDFLGDNLPPDELNVIEEGRNYGWPYCYGKSIRDLKFRELEALERCRDITQPSTFDYPAHVAPLGITFINSDFLGKDNQGDLLIAFHGSWNSSLPVGYKIVKLNLSDDKVVGMEDFITGWYENGKLLGRPVDLLFKDNQTLFISDDKAGVVYILTKNNK